MATRVRDFPLPSITSLDKLDPQILDQAFEFVGQTSQLFSDPEEFSRGLEPLWTWLGSFLSRAEITACKLDADETGALAGKDLYTSQALQALLYVRVKKFSRPSQAVTTVQERVAQYLADHPEEQERLEKDPQYHQRLLRAYSRSLRQQALTSILSHSPPAAQSINQQLTLESLISQQLEGIPKSIADPAVKQTLNSIESGTSSAETAVATLIAHLEQSGHPVGQTTQDTLNQYFRVAASSDAGSAYSFPTTVNSVDTVAAVTDILHQYRPEDMESVLKEELSSSVDPGELDLLVSEIISSKTGQPDQTAAVVAQILNRHTEIKDLPPVELTDIETQESSIRNLLKEFSRPDIDQAIKQLETGLSQHPNEVETVVQSIVSSLKKPGSTFNEDLVFNSLTNAAYRLVGADPDHPFPELPSTRRLTPQDTENLISLVKQSSESDQIPGAIRAYFDQKTALNLTPAATKLLVSTLSDTKPEDYPAVINRINTALPLLPGFSAADHDQVVQLILTSDLTPNQFHRLVDTLKTTLSVQNQDSSKSPDPARVIRYANLISQSAEPAQAVSLLSQAIKVDHPETSHTEAVLMALGLVAASSGDSPKISPILVNQVHSLAIKTADTLSSLGVPSSQVDGLTAAFLPQALASQSEVVSRHFSDLVQKTAALTNTPPERIAAALPPFNPLSTPQLASGFIAASLRTANEAEALVLAEQYLTKLGVSSPKEAAEHYVYLAKNLAAQTSPQQPLSETDLAQKISASPPPSLLFFSPLEITLGSLQSEPAFTKLTPEKQLLVSQALSQVFTSNPAATPTQIAAAITQSIDSPRISNQLVSAISPLVSFPSLPVVSSDLVPAPLISTAVSKAKSLGLTPSQVSLIETQVTTALTSGQINPSQLSVVLNNLPLPPSVAQEISLSLAASYEQIRRQTQIQLGSNRTLLQMVGSLSQLKNFDQTVKSFAESTTSDISVQVAKNFVYTAAAGVYLQDLNLKPETQRQIISELISLNPNLTLENRRQTISTLFSEIALIQPQSSLVEALSVFTQLKPDDQVVYSQLLLKLSSPQPNSPLPEPLTAILANVRSTLPIGSTHIFDLVSPLAVSQISTRPAESLQVLSQALMVSNKVSASQAAILLSPFVDAVAPQHLTISTLHGSVAGHLARISSSSLDQIHPFASEIAAFKLANPQATAGELRTHLEHVAVKMEAAGLKITQLEVGSLTHHLRNFNLEAAGDVLLKQTLVSQAMKSGLTYADAALVSQKLANDIRFTYYLASFASPDNLRGPFTSEQNRAFIAQRQHLLLSQTDPKIRTLIKQVNPEAFLNMEQLGQVLDSDPKYRLELPDVKYASHKLAQLHNTFIGNIPEPLKKSVVHFFAKTDLGQKILTSNLGRHLGLQSFAVRLGLSIDPKFRGWGAFSTFDITRPGRSLRVAARATRSYLKFGLSTNPLTVKGKQTVIYKGLSGLGNRILKSGAVQAVGKAAAGAAAKMGLSSALTSLTTALGSAVPVVGNIAGFVIGWVGGEIIGRSISWLWNHTKQSAVLGLGVALVTINFSGSLVLGLGLGLTATGVTAYIGGSPVLGLIGSRVLALITSLLSVAVAAIAAPVIFSLLALPIIITLLLFIINSSGYVLPESKFSLISATSGSSTPFPMGPGGDYPQCWPVKGIVTQGPACTPGTTSHCRFRSNAIDIAGNSGYPIYATHDGTLSNSCGDPNYGNCVIIRSPLGFVTYYAHMVSRSPFADGTPIKGGTQLGNVGSTGNSTGPHLHYEYRPPGQDIRGLVPNYALLAATSGCYAGPQP